MAADHRLVVALVGIGLLVGSGIGVTLGHAAEEEEQAAPSPSRPPAARSSRGGSSREPSASAASSSSAASTAKLEKKLDQVLANEQEILKRFDQVMEELRIIKVRSSIAASRGSGS